MTANGDPHGMHTIGSTWVSRHGDMVGGSSTQCANCHGADYRGSPLSQMKVARTYSAEGRTVNLVIGQNLGCYDCHNGLRPQSVGWPQGAHCGVCCYRLRPSSWLLRIDLCHLAPQHKALTLSDGIQLSMFSK
jgi:hypothetical protein